MQQSQEIADTLASLSLFADLSRPQAEAVARIFEEEWFADGQRILRQGFTGSNFYIILEGEAIVRIDGQERGRLRRGDFFGEMSLLLGEPPAADIVAAGDLHCIALAGVELSTFLLDHPTVSLRMLGTMARRLRTANASQS